MARKDPPTVEEVPESKVQLLPRPPVWVSFCSSLLSIAPETTWEEKGLFRLMLPGMVQSLREVRAGTEARTTVAYLSALHCFACLLVCLTQDHLPTGSMTHINH